MRSIKDRVAALEAALLPRMRQLHCEDMDPLSQALVGVVEELKALDTPERRAAYCKGTGLAEEQLEAYIQAMTAEL